MSCNSARLYLFAVVFLWLRCDLIRFVNRPQALNPEKRLKRNRGREMENDRKKERKKNRLWISFTALSICAYIARSARGDLTLYEGLKCQMHYRCARAVLGARASEKVSLLWSAACFRLELRARGIWYRRESLLVLT